MAPSSFNKKLAEALFDLEVPRDTKFSPDGKHVLWWSRLMHGTRKTKNHVSTLWLASSSESGSARPLTSGFFDDTSPAWHPSGNQVIFLSDRVKPGESSAIYTMRLDGGDAIPVTPPKNAQGIEEFVVSPDGKTIAYISPDEESDNEDDEDDPDPEVWGAKWEHARLRLVVLASKETQVLAGGDRHIISLDWSPDGRSVVFLSNANPHIEEAMLTGTTISTVDIETGNVRELCKVMNELNELTWAPDGRIYFITGTPDDSDLAGCAVYAVDPTVASPTHTNVASGIEDDASSLVLTCGKLLLNRGVRQGSVISELNGQNLLENKREIMDWDVTLDTDSGAPKMSCTLSTVEKPIEVYIVQPGKEDIQLSNYGRGLEKYPFGACSVFQCQSADGEVELDGLYLTPTSKTDGNGTPREPLPTFVIVHGGPNSRDSNCFDTTPFHWAPYVLTKGYGVLLPQYRGSAGRGERFASYSRGGQGKYDYADVVTITDRAIKKGWADKKKLLVGGWSQGGLITYLCSVRNGLHGLGWRFNATIAGAGVCDIESLVITADLGSTCEVELAGGHTAWTLSKDDTRNRQGSALWEVAAAVEESKRTGEPVIPPMLILHGDKDVRCPFSQADGYRRALRAHGLPCEFVAYPGEGHGIRRRKFLCDMLERIGRWCDTYIGEDLAVRAMV